MVLDIIKRVRFAPYRKGMGPTFTLTMWDTHRTDGIGKSMLGYRLRANGATIFEGEDFGCSPLHCIDSTDTVKSLMGFLTLRPGDTDDEYFTDYTPEQLEYAEQHAEALASEVEHRFGE